MKYLLDTHVLIWFAEGDNRLPLQIRSIILDQNNSIFVSYASIWEMAIKISLGKLIVQFKMPEWESMLNEKGFSIISLNFQHFQHLINLPFHHSDPFDRLLIAQAAEEDFTIITHDAIFKHYDVLLEAF